MRDRLIQKFTKAKKGSLGYTLMEMLVVVGIIAIVCAIAIPSVIAISRALRFRQRNDYAKAIFMAAQANLTEMRSDGGLAPLRGAGAYSYPVEQGQSGFPNEDWSDEYVYIASQDASMEPIYALVLPVNSVESQLREQQVIIEYNPITGNVYSVFYSEDSQMKAEDGTEGTLLELYRAGKLPRNAEGDEKLRKDMMLGYYDGSGLSSSQLEMERTRAELEFENGEEGIVTVLVPMPDLYIGEYMEFMRGLEVELTLEPDRELKQSESQLPEIVLTIKEAGEVGENCSLDVDGRTVLITYVLDSLADRRSFANLSAGTYAGDTATLAEGTAESLTAILEETEFTILPGENVVITADVQFVPESDRPAVTIDPAVLDGVNPMFAYLEENLAGTGYTLAVENGRNLQNLNAIAPSVANQVSTVVLIDDIYWNKTVAYYNDVYAAAGNTYQNNDDEAPARRLPYFVPIYNDALFGAGKFNTDERNISILGITFITSSNVPTLSDAQDTNANSHAKISGRLEDGSAARVYNLNINATKYKIPNNTLPARPTEADKEKQGHYYVTYSSKEHPVNYEFTGLFGYINTTIDSVHVVNPIVKGYPFVDEEKDVKKYFLGIPYWTKDTVYGNPATGALVGATGYNCQFTNCATYIDTTDPSFDRARMAQGNYDKDADQTWYGVSGEGAVGGLVGYAKSHRTTSGEINGDLSHLAFSNCFAAVNVSGNMRGNELKHFGYSNGIGGLIGNSQLTNFYNCYASGNVRAGGCYVDKTVAGTIADIVAQLFGQKVDLLYNGRTSMGAGGFVGTSHGTRYTNCFSAGNVSASASRGSEEYKGAGGFVGIMSYEETYSYGNDDENNNAYAQHTVFENCYAAGVATLGGVPMENFSGANARIKLKLQTTGTYLVGNYYRALAPFYCGSVPGYAAGSYPSYETMYIFKDAYYLSQYPGTTQNNTNKCATVESYENLTKLHTAHRDERTLTEGGWIQTQIEDIKNISLGFGNTYETRYFDNYANLEGVYVNQYKQGFTAAVWGNISATQTHPYSLALTGLSYPFSMINGLPYYGDWPGKPAYAGIAYYEDYEDNTSGYYFSNDETATLENEKVIENDGYAILSANSTDTVMVTINGVTQQLSCVNNEQYKPGGLSAVEAYSVFRIPGTMYKTLAATQSDNFYVTANVTITNTDGETDTYTMYFNPFTAVSQVAGTDTAPTTNPKEVYIRTARQFAALSCERMRCVWGNKDVTITQQLDIDAEEYDEYDWNGDGTVTDADKAPVLESIGNAEHPFAATYSGAGGYVSQAEIKGFLPETAFFSNIAADGTVRKLRISIEGAGANEAPVIIGLENDGYAAVVAAVSAGTLDDVDVTVTGELTIRARNAAGILVGNAAGTAAKRTTIQGCDVAAEKLTVNAQHAGGAIGMLTYGDVVKGQTAEMTEDPAGVVINGLFTAEGDAVGGFVGHATDLNVDALPIKLNGISAEAQLVGGFAGSITTGTIQNLTLDLSGRYTAVAENTDAGTETKSVLAGAAAHAEDAAFQTVNVKLLGTLTGDTAAGVFGDAIDLTVQVTEAEITGTVNGTAAAAGMAANIEAGTFSGASVKLSGTIQAMGTEADEPIGRAAGFAVSIKGKVGEGTVALGAYTYTQKEGKNVSVAATTNSGYVKGNLEAAGFACEITADVTGSKVAGIGSVESDGTAAGFALKITGDGLNASENAVTPAFLNTTADYLYNSNANLKVNGNTASLFAVELGKGVTATNCYALGTVTGKGENPVISGFVDTNAGTINGASANVAMAGGYAFVRSNTGSIINSYGWYGDGKLEGNQTKAVINADAQAAAGTVTGSYFADLDVPAMYEDEIKLMDAAIADNYRSMVVYDSTGKMSKMAPTGLSKAILNGSGSRWFDAASYAEYPYSKLIPANYPYPKLRIHYGNWSNPPQYAYGVVYYEQYADNTWKLAVQDLSNPDVTIEDAPLTSKDTFNKEGTIVDAGYALFFKGTADKNPMKQLTNATLGEALQVSHDALGSKYVYNFYKLIPSAATVTVTEVLENPEPNEKADSVTLGVYYAHEFGEVSEHVVRTEAQLMRVAATGNYRQTHDIALSASYTLLPAFGGQYAGENCTISGADKGIMNGVTGSVINLNVTASNLNASLFGTIGQKATVQLNDLTLGTVGANGNVATTVNGTLTLSKNLEISGQVSSAKGVIETVNGVLNCSSVTVQGSLNGKLIGTVAANATFGVSTINTADIGSGGTVIGTMKKGAWLTNGKITTGNVSGTVIGTLEGTQVSGLTVKTGLINQGGKVFGSVASGAKLTDLTFDYSGDLNGKFVETVSGNGTVVSVKNDLNLGSVSGSLFEKVEGGKVTVQNVTATAVSGKFFGDTAGEVTTGNLTVNGAVSGQLFGKVTGKVAVVDIKSGDISAKAQVFGDIAANATVETNNIVTSTIAAGTADAKAGQIFGKVEGTVEVQHIKVSTGTNYAAVKGQVFGDITGKVTVATIYSSAVSGQIFGNVKNTAQNVLTVTKINTNGGEVSGQIFGAADYVTIKGIISTGEIKSTGKVFGNSAGTITVGTEGTTGAVITTGNVSGQIFGDVADVTVNGNIRADIVEGKVFGTVAANKTANIKGQISIDTTKALKGKIFEGVAGEVILNNGITLGDIADSGEVFGDGGNPEISVNYVDIDGDIKAGSVEGKIFANVNQVNLRGSIVTGEIGETGQIFGNVTTNGYVQLSDIKVEANDAPAAVNGKIFGAVSGKTQIRNISTGVIGAKGQIFGDVDIKANADDTNKLVVNGITTNGNAVNGKVFGSVKNVKINGSITAGEVVNGGQIFGDVTGITTVGSINVGAVNGKLFNNVKADVTVGGITTGTVNSSLITTLTSGTVTTGKISVADLTKSLVGTFNGGILQGASDAKTAISIHDGNGTITADLFANAVSGTVRNYTITVAKAGAGLTTTLSGTMSNVDLTVNSAMTANVITTFNGTTVEKLVVTIKGDMGGSLIKVATKNVNGLTLTVNGKLTADVMSEAAGVSGLTVTVDKDMTGSLIGKASGSITGATNVKTLYVKGSMTPANKYVIGNVKGAVNTVTLDIDGALTGNAVTSAGSVNTLTVTVGTEKATDYMQGNVIGTASGNVKALNVTVNGYLKGSVIGTAASVGDTNTNGVTAVIHGYAEGNLIGTVDGAVNSSMLTVDGALTGDGLFRAGSVEGLTVTVGTNKATDYMQGNVIGAASGNVKALNVTVNGYLKGSVIGTAASIGDTNTNGVTAVIHGYAEGNLIGTVDGAVNSSNLTVNGALTGNAVTSAGSVNTLTVTVGTEKATDYMQGNVIGAASGNVTTLDVTVNGYLKGSVIGTAAVGGNTNATVSGTTATIHGYAEGNLIGTVDGAVNSSNLTVNGALTGNAVTSAGSVTDLSVMVTGDMGGSFVGAVTTGGITGTADGKTKLHVTGSMTPENKYVIGSVKGAVNTVTLDIDGTLTGNAVNSASSVNTLKILVGGNMTGNGIVTANGNITTLTLDVTGELRASAIGSIGEKVTSISGVTVKAGTVDITANGNFGVITAVLPSNVTLSGSSVKVDTLNVHMTGAGSIGGLVGVNNGTINGGKVSNKADNGAMAMTVDNANAAAVIIGGLTGTNSNTIGGTTSVKTSITYVQPTATNDNATIGGLVGEMTAGTLGESKNLTSVSGSIQLKKASGSNYVDGSASGRNYIVGGAVGKDGGATYTGVNATVNVSTNWNGALLLNTNAALTVDKINPSGAGPIGKFVGYISTGKFNNCSGLDQNTATAYQFMGEITASVMTPDAYKNAVYSEGQVTAYQSGEDAAFYVDKATNANNKFETVDSNILYVTYAAELKDCFYSGKLGEDSQFSKIKQTIEASTYFYSLDSQSVKTIYNANVATAINNGKMYVITYAPGDGSTYALMDSNGEKSKLAVSKTTFNDVDDVNMLKTVWCVDANGRWKNFSTGNYISLTSSGTFIKRYTLSMTSTESSGAVISSSFADKACKLNYGSVYLSYSYYNEWYGSANEFSASNANDADTFIVYEITTAGAQTEGKFSYKSQDEMLKYEVVEVIPVTLSLLDETDLPGETGEASEATESTGSTEVTESNETAESTQATETATEPPAPEDGTNN